MNNLTSDPDSKSGSSINSCSSFSNFSAKKMRVHYRYKMSLWNKKCQFPNGEPLSSVVQCLTGMSEENCGTNLSILLKEENDDIVTRFTEDTHINALKFSFQIADCFLILNWKLLFWSPSFVYITRRSKAQILLQTWKGIGFHMRVLFCLGFVGVKLKRR